MYRVLLLICFLSISTQLDAQLSGQAKIDSLLAELPNAKGDTNHVNLFQQLSYEYYRKEPNKGIEYGTKGVKLAKEIKWKRGEAINYNSLGINSAVKSDLYKALDYFNKSLEINIELGNKPSIANSLGNIGNIYKIQSNYSMALEYQKKSLRIDEELGNKSGVASSLGNIGNIYINLSEYPNALDYYDKALRIYEELGDKSGVANCLGNIGSIYKYQSNYSKALDYYNKALSIHEETDNKPGIARHLSKIGIIYENMSDYTSALDNFRKALIINKKLGIRISIAVNLSNIGNIYKNTYKYTKALEYYEKALKVNQELGRKSGTAKNLGNIGELHLKISQDSVLTKIKEKSELVTLDKEVNLNNSISYLSKSIELLEDIGELNDRSGFLKNLSDAYRLKGDMTKAYEALEEHHKLKDSVFNQENADKIAALEKAREDDLKQKEIEKQKLKIAEQEKREQLILYFSIGFILVMAVVMFIIYRLLKRSDKLLYNVLPVSIAKRLKKKEHPISDYFTQASIVFIDIVNFTEMAKDEDPRRLVEELNKIFTHYDTIANKYGLEKIKTIGDSYMAAAGIPEVQKDNTHRAAQMALEVKQLMSDYRTEDGTKIEVRIGLDCGPVVAGVIGENKFIYDMWSDAVNTASRMESSSETGQVHITDRFKEAVSEYEEFEYVERGEIEIKGKGIMKTYYIENKEVESV